MSGDGITIHLLRLRAQQAGLGRLRIAAVTEGAEELQGALARADFGGPIQRATEPRPPEQVKPGTRRVKPETGRFNLWANN